MIHPTAPALRRAYADGKYGQIHYYDAGGEGVPLLLLHQSPAASSDWFPLLPYFEAAGFRVLMMDTPGMGLSDALPHEPTLDDYSDAVPVVLDHAGVASAHLLGHHTGVQIAIEAAARFADRVRSSSLYGVPVMSKEEQERYWQQIVTNEKVGAIHHPVEGGTNITDHFRRIENFYSVIGSQRMILSALMAGPLWWHGHNAALRHDMVPALIAATQPILLISNPGEMLDANTSAAAALRPDADYVMLATPGKMAPDDDPEGLANAVIAFVKKVEAERKA
ncbi:MAG TPA: alpha/beta fold hydrolase [Sphingobium sp.]